VQGNIARTNNVNFEPYSDAESGSVDAFGAVTAKESSIGFEGAMADEEDGSPFQLAAMGPVETIFTNDDGLVSITVLGQEFLSAQPQVGVSEGEYVFAGSFADSRLDLLVPVGEDYVFGVSDIQLVGEIQSVDASRAEFSIGDLAIDYSNLLADSPGFAPSPGDIVEISGNQFSSKAPILLGIHGSGVRGIHGSGVRGIHGSGVRGIHGSGVRGIHGSGVRGIHGSGVRGIHGSGVRGIHGSGVRGIHGSGVRGIHGSGVRGIHGSGAR